jgi:hypothetical protein
VTNGLHRHGAFDHYIGQTTLQEISMKPIFVQPHCAPGKTYEVADAIYQH